jgi:hypothetical protein
MSENKVNEKQTAVKSKTVEDLIANSEAGDIWKEIKDKPIEMFALPDQKIFQHASPAYVEPSKLYLVTRATSVLPAIELAVGKKFNVELVDRYVVVSRVVVPLTQR